MLYDGFIRFSGEAIEGFESGDIKAARRAIQRAVAIVQELNASLRHDGEGDLAAALSSLYLFVEERLYEANRHSEPQRIVDARGVMLELRGAWSELAASPPSESDIEAS